MAVLASLLLCLPTATSFQAPCLGLTSLLFPIRNRVTIESLSDSSSNNRRQTLQEASDFFVDAFWTAKVGGGTRQLTSQQMRTLQQSQLSEFNQRYGRNRPSADLLVCRLGKPAAANKKNAQNDNPIVACVGVEIDAIPDGSLRGPARKKAPLMSNLAVSRSYRRRGLAQLMVQAVEQRIVQEYEFSNNNYNNRPTKDTYYYYDSDDQISKNSKSQPALPPEPISLYLYVEQRNRAAVQLYRSMGYRTVWTDPTAQILLPTSDGALQSMGTTIVCMVKSLKVPRQRQASPWSM